MSQVNLIPKFYGELLQEYFEIMAAKNQIQDYRDDLSSREKEVGEKLKLFIKNNGPIETPNGRLEVKENFTKRTFQRDRTIEYIRHKYGDEMADDVDENCTIINQSEGLWFYQSKYRKIQNVVSQE
jgi:hypothetical protein